MSNLLSLFKSFAKRKEGSTATMLGLTFTMVTGATLGAVEIENAHRLESNIQKRMDATVIYLGKSEEKTDPQALGTQLLTDMLIEAGIISNDDSKPNQISDYEMTFEFDPETGEVKGNMSFKPMPIAIPINDIMTTSDKLEVEAVASPKIMGRVEISMVLDTSGSMAWGFEDNNPALPGSRRMDGLHEAAEAMFDVIYQNPLAEPAVAVTPYAASVDITDIFAGRTYAERMDEFEGFGNKDLEDDLNLADMTSDDLERNDRTHTQGVWAAERYKNKRQDGTYNITQYKASTNSKIPVYTEYDYAVNDYNAGYHARVFCDAAYVALFGQECVKGYKHHSWSTYYLGGFAKPTNGLLPMTKNAQQVRDYVASFSPDGGTAAHIGAAWGLYNLTPSWQHHFDPQAGRAEWWTDTTEKYLVIMTDGKFNSQKDPNMTDDDMYSYFQSVCTKARDLGVRIFTVGLLLDEQTDRELAECAGNTGVHFPVDTRLELVDAFRAVGRATGELRLSH